MNKVLNSQMQSGSMNNNEPHPPDSYENGYQPAWPGAFSFFKAPAKSVNIYRNVSVKDIYKYITLYRPAMGNTLDLRKITDPKEARNFKSSKFDFVCFSGTFSYRNDESLIEHSGLLCLDFDHVGDKQALWALREKLIQDRNFVTWLLFISPSGDGLKWVIEIDLAKCDHRTWFRAMQNYIRATYGLKVDEKCVNVSRACFLPHDSNCYVNPIILNEPDVCPF